MNLTPVNERGNLLPWRSAFDDFFQGLFDGRVGSRLPDVFRGQAMPPVNVSETDRLFTVAVELPGLDEKDIQLQLMGNQLTISGERKWEEEKKGKEFHRVESQYGAFSRTVPLPGNLRTDSADAVYKKGVLTVNFPKVEPTPSAKIKVKAE